MGRARAGARARAEAWVGARIEARLGLCMGRARFYRQPALGLQDQQCWCDFSHLHACKGSGEGYDSGWGTVDGVNL